jgi:hypothetical protein
MYMHKKSSEEKNEEEKRSYNVRRNDRLLLEEAHDSMQVNRARLSGVNASEEKQTPQSKKSTS